MKLALALVATIAASSCRANVSRATPPGASGWLGIGYTFQVTDGSAGRVVWLFVKETAPGGPAERAGLKPQDVITALDGRPLWFRNEVDALNFFERVKAGDTLVLQVRRGGTARDVTVVAANAPSDVARLRKNNQSIAKAHQTP